MPVTMTMYPQLYRPGWGFDDSIGRNYLDVGGGNSGEFFFGGEPTRSPQMTQEELDEFGSLNRHPLVHESLWGGEWESSVSERRGRGRPDGKVHDGMAPAGRTSFMAEAVLAEEAQQEAAEEEPPPFWQSMRRQQSGGIMGDIMNHPSDSPLPLHRVNSAPTMRPPPPPQPTQLSRGLSEGAAFAPAPAFAPPSTSGSGETGWGMDAIDPTKPFDEIDPYDAAAEIRRRQWGSSVGAVMGGGDGGGGGGGGGGGAALAHVCSRNPPPHLQQK